ncbi:MAG TPA: hypothetical protein VIF62_23570 [Labilithrix sp.]
MSNRALLVVASLLVLTGCTASSTNDAQPSSSSGGAASDAGTQPLTCLGILQCVTTDNCATNACVDACMQQGASAAQKQLTDLATCSQSEMCSDATCLQSKCKSQLDACIQGSKPADTGSALSGNAPAGSVPSDWVGTWQAGDASNLTNEKEFVFGADGSGQFIESYNGSLSNCASGLVEKYIGTAVIDASASAIKVYATKVEEITNTCGQPVTTDKPQKTLSFTYEPTSDNDGIMITDADCAAQYAGDSASANLYCRYTYRKAQ